MNWTGLVCVLAIAIIAGILFGLYPELDLDIVRHFHAVETKTTNHEVFALRLYPAFDTRTQIRPVVPGATGDPCGRRACDQAHVAVAQIVDAGPSGRFSDCNDDPGTRHHGQCGS